MDRRGNSVSKRVCPVYTSRLLHTLNLARCIGAAFTLLFVVMWVAYALGQMDVGGVIFISGVAVFAIPLLVGSILVLHRKEAGLPLMKLGSVLLIAEPLTFFAIWFMKDDPEYRQYVSRSS